MAPNQLLSPAGGCRQRSCDDGRYYPSRFTILTYRLIAFPCGDLLHFESQQKSYVYVADKKAFPRTTACTVCASCKQLVIFNIYYVKHSVSISLEHEMGGKHGSCNSFCISSRRSLKRAIRDTRDSIFLTKRINLLSVRKLNGSLMELFCNIQLTFQSFIVRSLNLIRGDLTIHSKLKFN